MQSTEKQKNSTRFGLVGKNVALVVLALSVAGCVAEPSPRGYYGSYPNESYYNAPADRTIVADPGDTIIVRDRHSGYYYDDNRPVHDYDNHWDYGRRGNGNFHGTDADDRHDD